MTCHLLRSCVASVTCLLISSWTVFLHTIFAWTNLTLPWREGSSAMCSEIPCFFSAEASLSSSWREPRRCLLGGPYSNCTPCSLSIIWIFKHHAQRDCLLICASWSQPSHSALAQGTGADHVQWSYTCYRCTCTVLNSTLSCLVKAYITVILVTQCFYVGFYVLALPVDFFFSLSITVFVSINHWIWCSKILSSIRSPVLKTMPAASDVLRPLTARSFSAHSTTLSCTWNFLFPIDACQAWS